MVFGHKIYAVLLPVIYNITNHTRITTKLLQYYCPTMASTTNNINIEWVNSLVGLPVKKPDNWWAGYTGTYYLHDGTLFFLEET
jgi:hypothetical protein